MKFAISLPFLALPLLAPATPQEGERSPIRPVDPAERSHADEPRPEQGLVPRAASPVPEERADRAPFQAVRPRGGAFLGVHLSSDGARTSVADVLPNTPAAAAGLVAGDRILSVGGRAATDPNSVVAEIARRAPGERVTLEIVRDGRVQEIEVELAARPIDRVEGQDEEPAPMGRAPAPFFRTFEWPRLSPQDEEGMRRWLEQQERRSEHLREQLERQFSELRREFGRDLDGVRRDLERELGRGGRWLGERFGDGRMPRALDIPADAWADLEKRLAPLEEQRQKIARDWAEAHGHPEWADAVPQFGVRVRIEQRTERTER